MVKIKIKKSIKTKKQNIPRSRNKNRDYAVLKKYTQTSAKYYHANHKQYGGAGRIVKQWHDMPEFKRVNDENEAHLQLSNTYKDKPQHEIYYSELASLLEDNY